MYLLALSNQWTSYSSLLSLCLESVYASSADLGCQAPNDNESDKGLQG